MNSVIYNPLEEYNNRLKSLHLEHTNRFFEKLVQQSNVNIEENRKTVKQYDEYRENLKKLKRKRNWLLFFRVLMFLTILLIPLVIWKINPIIKKLKEDIELADDKIEELLAKAYKQMAPLNGLFTDRDALNLIESTIPSMSFDLCFSAKQELDMKTNYDFCDFNDDDQSTTDVLSGEYNGNPFLFENRLVHTMGTETYYGYKTISWTETYRDSDGRLRRRTRTQTLQASVTKPKPYYTNQVILKYGSQGGPDLSFSRDGTHLERKSERQIERYVKRGEKKLDRLTDKAISQNKDFMSMSNTDFEVLFDALDRTNEVQYRTIFTPLAQTNMVDLILSTDGYGDDFDFIKRKRMNKIVSDHSQGRELSLSASNYVSYSFDIIKENFIGKNTEFFKAVYFDFAPILAIPIYQEKPAQSLMPIPDYSQLYAYKEFEVMANAANPKYLVHPDTKTKAIYKTSFVKSQNQIDETCITAYSYDIEPRVDIVSVWGDDGHCHNVSVPWDEYIPLENSNNFFVATADVMRDKNVIGKHNNLCLSTTNS